MRKDVFIFVPAYNVERTLSFVLRKISPAMWMRSRLLVVDDGSKDKTGDAFREFVSGMPEEDRESVRYERFPENRGYGAVVKFGIKEGLASGARYIACLHGDAQYPAEMLDCFIEEFEKRKALPRLALLQGSRHAVAGEAKKGGMPFYKRVGGAFLTAVENIAFREPLTDRHSGYIVYSSEFLDTVEIDKLSASFDIDLELIALADASEFAVGEIPIPTRYAEEKSNLNVIPYGLRVLRQTFRRLRKPNGKH